MITCLTIAGSDSSCGAGLQMDLRVLRDLGVKGACAVTCVTAQNSQGVGKILKVAPRIIAAQIDSVCEDFDVRACKVGMLFSQQAVDIVVERIARREIPNLVVDPVMKAKRGEELLAEPAIKRLKRKLLPKALIVTPNADEASVLTGICVNGISSAREAARALVGMGAQYALVKGGHITGDPVDVLYGGGEFVEFSGLRINRKLHGTGCILSSAIAGRLALGDTPAQAVLFAKNYVSKAIECSEQIGNSNVYYYL